jgi:hypothetical protein
MSLALDTRYRRKWFIGPTRAQIYDGVRWIWLSKIGTERQRELDKNFRESKRILQKLGDPCNKWAA